MVEHDKRIPLVDGHLDLASGVIHGQRDLEHLTPLEIRLLEGEGAKTRGGYCMATLSEIRKAGIAVTFATLWAMPRILWTHPEQPREEGYTTPEEAEAQALEQLALYEGWAARGQVRILKSRADLEQHLQRWKTDSVTGLILLMEGADPIVQPSDVPEWWSRGLRIVGTSWGQTRYAGGTDAPGGLTASGRELVAALRDQKIILDASHQSWEAFFESLEVGVHRVIATHANAYALTPSGNRHLSDEMIRAIGHRNGVVGTVLFNGFLEPRWTEADRSVPVTLEGQVRSHMTHIANLIGWDKVAIGSDIDGGLGLDETPLELETIADLHRVGNVVPQDARAGVLGGNWLRFLLEALP